MNNPLNNTYTQICKDRLPHYLLLEVKLLEYLFEHINENSAKSQILGYNYFSSLNIKNTEQIQNPISRISRTIQIPYKQEINFQGIPEKNFEKMKKNNISRIKYVNFENIKPESGNINENIFLELNYYKHTAIIHISAQDHLKTNQGYILKELFEIVPDNYTNILSTFSKVANKIYEVLDENNALI